MHSILQGMRILVTGGSGMLGRAILDQLQLAHKEFTISAPKRSELDLLDYMAVKEFLISEKFDLVIHCAALVGGIKANIEHPFEFLNTNIRIDSNLMNASLGENVTHFMYMASSCMYPAITKQPMTENQLLSGELEKTNEGYALAKLVGIKMIEAKANQLNWRAFILSNLYGPGDKYGETNSHLIAAIIKKVSEAVRNKESFTEMWGTGNVRREFTYVEDIAQYLVKVIPKMNSLPSVMNLGAGIDYSVRDYYQFVCEQLSYKGEIRSNSALPEGMREKLMDSSLAKSHGWAPTTTIRDGIRMTIDDFTSSHRASR